MIPKKPSAARELYRKLRTWPCERLWNEEVPRFNQAAGNERVNSVGLIRAIGVVFAEQGTAAQKEEARVWLRDLLQDPEEKVRRYAMTALPKLGADPADEAKVLALLENPTSARELKFVGRTLDKIGGAATLTALQSQPGGSLPQTELKLRASVARLEPSSVRMERALARPGLILHLRCRRGLEAIVREEVEAQGQFRVHEIWPGLVTVSCSTPFTLGDVYALRCFATVGFSLGEVSGPRDQRMLDELAAIMTSDLAREIFAKLTDGPLRYRLEFSDQGHQRGIVRELANKAYARCPDILNDAREAPWIIMIHSTHDGSLVELSPRLKPDPRFDYRRADVPAASHPPLAACLARAGGPLRNATVWDPFCGSGLELVERAILGGVKDVHGSDRSPEAIAIARENFAAANPPRVRARFTCGDFRDFARSGALGANSLDLILTNPPMGKRVPVPNLRGLILDLLAVAGTMLRPGGRLVFPNPVPIEKPPHGLVRISQRIIDLGGFDCRLETYRKAG